MYIHHVPKCTSCHKAIVVITGSSHCFHDNIYIIIYKYVYIYIYIYIHTLRVFKRRKQLIWNLNFHADTAAIFSQMNKTLNLQYHGIFCII